MKKIITLTVFSLILTASAFAQNTAYEKQMFFDHLKSLCGNSFAGEVIHPETPPRGFTDPLVAHFTVCEDNIVHIPFHVGENQTRTWMLTLSDEGILFKHDHRNPDGTPDGLTNYGGWADERGNELKQYFPADEETIGFRDNLRSHIWVIEISEDMSTYSYSLYIWENLYFKADFDLTKPLD